MLMNMEADSAAAVRPRGGVTRCVISDLDDDSRNSHGWSPVNFIEAGWHYSG